MLVIETNSTNFASNASFCEPFMAQSASVAREYVDYVSRSFVALVKSHGTALALTSAMDPDAAFMRKHIYPACDRSMVAGKVTYSLNLGKLDVLAQAYGVATCRDWLEKTAFKMGAVEKPVLTAQQRGTVVISGRREGREIVINQRRVLTQSTLGRLYHQYPARIYVDGAPISESVYRKMFEVKPAAPVDLPDEATLADLPTG